MTREDFIRKWLTDYTEEKRDEMRDDLDRVVSGRGLTIEQRKEKFTLQLNEFSEQYPHKMLVDFYEYWTEHGVNDRKMRFEKEKSFGLSRRLATWKRNQERYEANSKNYSNSFKSDTTRRTIENFRQRVEQKG